MSYKSGENVIDYSFCEADLIHSAKKNVRFFIEIIIGLVIGIGLLGVLGSTLLGSISCLGSCLGCEECVESAAFADECMYEMGCEDCSDDYYDDMGCWEEIATENYETANECATCEGIDCFGREGCFASEGCGDCEHCAGTMYYSVTIVAGEQRKTLEIDEEQARLGVYYPAGAPSDYYKFLGYYDKEAGGTMYVNSEGTIVKTLVNGMTLYGRYQEYRVNEAITFYLELEELGEHDKTIALTIGSPMLTMPTAPEKEGYDFVGWYMNGQLVYSGNVSQNQIFHLYTFGLDVFASEGPYTLTPRYEAKRYEVKFVVYDSTYTLIANYNTTFGQLYQQFYRNYYNLEGNERFFGWGTNLNTAPENKIKDDEIVVSDITLYPIFREPVTATFYTNSPYLTSTITVKLYEGQTNVLFGLLDELAIVNEESAYPGYQFVGWYKSYNADDAQATDRIDVVNQYNDYVYYGVWKTTDYKIEYYAMHYDSDTVSLIDTKTYNYSSSSVALKPAEEATKNYGYNFVGWCLNEDCSDTPRMELDPYTYGNKKVYAKYTPKTYDYSWFTNGGTVDGWMDGTDEVVYGQENYLPVPTREGYNFLGWKLDGTNIMVGDENGYVNKFTFNTLGLETTLASDNKLTNEGFLLMGVWEVQTFTVKFMIDGKTYNEQTINWGQKVVLPDDPTKKGYEFIGWYTEEGQQFFAATDIKKDWTLIARFDINRYTVIFYVDGMANIAESVPHGTTLSEAETMVNYWGNGYYDNEQRKKIGWFDSMNDDAIQYTTDFLIEKDEVKVYAHFEYAKVFNFIEAESQQTRYYFVGEKYVFPEADKPGYEFLGWGTSETSSTVTVAKGAEYRIKEDSKLNWYPKFKAIDYKITYYFGNTIYANDTYTIEDEKQLLTIYDAPTKTGYTFVGWVVDSNGNYDYTDEYTGNNDNVLVTKLVNSMGDKKYLAAFKNNVYTVTLRNEGGNQQISVTYDKPFDFGVPASKEGCDFEGWAWKNYDVDEANKAIITTASGASKGVYDIDGNSSAYPIYTRKQYAFTWMADGSVATTTYQKHFDTKVTKPVDPIKEGYSFVGWYADSGLTQEYNFNHEVTGRETIYAKFSINQYTVKFTVGGSQKYSVSLTYNTSLSSAIRDAQQYVTEYATRETANFKFWRDSWTGNHYDENSKVPARNMELIAVFDMPIYLIFNANGGVIYKTNNTSVTMGPGYGTATVTVPTVTRQGYTFVGWYKTNVDKVEGSQVSVSGSETSKTEVTYVARWQADTYNIYYYVNGTLMQTGTYTMEATEVSGGMKLWNGNPDPGQKLNGWYISSSYMGTAISAIDNTGKAEGNKTTGHIALYGKYETETYTITFKNKDGSTYKTMTVTYGQSLSTLTWINEYAALNNPDGQTFGGFVKGNVSYVNSAGVWATKYNTVTWTEDIVLTARWY